MFGKMVELIGSVKVGVRYAFVWIRLYQKIE